MKSSLIDETGRDVQINEQTKEAYPMVWNQTTDASVWLLNFASLGSKTSTSAINLFREK